MDESYFQEPSMAELLDQSFEDLKSIKVGSIIPGIVVHKSSGEMLVDVGGKSEGIITSRNMDQVGADYLSNISVGDEILVFVLHLEDEDGYIALSLNKAMIEHDWQKAEQAFEDGEIFEGEVVNTNKGGLIVNYGSVRGFVPGSQLVPDHNLASGDTNPWRPLIGQTLTLKIIEVDRERNRLIFSERLASEVIKSQKREEFLANLQKEDILDGQVVNLAHFGAFVDIGGVEGLVHLSELAWYQVSHPNEVVKVGDKVKVQVLDIDIARKRIGLSIKRLQPEPWSQAAEIYEVGQLVQGNVTKLTDFGAFARIDDRLDGLIHISELTERRISHPREAVSEGDRLEMRIISLEPERRRLGLSLRQVNEPDDVWDEAAEDVEEPSVTADVEEEAVINHDPVEDESLALEDNSST